MTETSLLPRNVTVPILRLPSNLTGSFRLGAAGCLGSRECIEHFARTNDNVLTAIELIRHRSVADRRGEPRVPLNIAILRIERDEIRGGIACE